MRAECLILAIGALTAANCELIDLNTFIDSAFADANEQVRKNGTTSSTVPAGSINDDVSYSESTLVGLDSVYRTGDCTMSDDGKTTTFDLHLGLKLWEQSFREMTIKGQNMSAVFRIRDNSIHFAFTFKYNGVVCDISLIDLSYERLAKVDFSSSVQEYDGINVDDFFQKEVLQAFNKMMESSKPSVEAALDKICKEHPGIMLEASFPHMFIQDYLIGI